MDSALADLLTKVESGGITDGGASTLFAAAEAGLARTQTTSDGHFQIGSPEKPHVQFDEDFVFGSQEPTAENYASLAKWRAAAAPRRSSTAARRTTKIPVSGPGWTARSLVPPLERSN